jgi:chromosome segregation ATPase
MVNIVPTGNDEGARVENMKSELFKVIDKQQSDLQQHFKRLQEFSATLKLFEKEYKETIDHIKDLEKSNEEFRQKYPDLDVPFDTDVKLQKATEEIKKRQQDADQFISELQMCQKDKEAQGQIPIAMAQNQALFPINPSDIYAYCYKYGFLDQPYD